MGASNMVFEDLFGIIMSLLQKGDLFTTETTEITETKDYFIFHQKYDCKNFYYMRQAAKKLSFYS
jgi:hypothetical protein